MGSLSCSYNIHKYGTFISIELSKTSQQLLKNWMNTYQIPNPVSNLCITLINSEIYVDDEDFTLINYSELLCENFTLEKWLSKKTTNTSLVLTFSHPFIEQRYAAARLAGASYQWQYYQPHIILSLNCNNINLDQFIPPLFPLVAIGEKRENKKNDWAIPLRHKSD